MRLRFVHLSGLYGSLVALLALLLASCSAAGSAALSTREPSLPEPGPAQAWPQFPGDSAGSVSLVRWVSATAVVNGAEWVAQAGGNRTGEVSPSGYVIVPGGEDDLAWAQYTIDGLNVIRPTQIALDVAPAKIVPGGEDDLPMRFWLGLSDYSNYEWEWKGPFENAGDLEDLLAGLDLNSEAVRQRYVSKSHRFHFVLVTQPSPDLVSETNPQGLAGLEIVTSTTTTLAATDSQYVSTFPHYTPVDAITIGDDSLKGGSALAPNQYVNVSWTHILDEINEHENEAAFYEVWRKRLGASGAEGQGRGINLATRFPSDTTFVDPTHVPAGKEAVPGAVYVYYIRAFGNTGFSGFAVADEAVIPLNAPTGLTASVDTFADGIHLSWDPIPGIKGFTVLRASEDAPGSAEEIAQLGDVADYTDTTAAPARYWYYWLRAIGEGPTADDADDAESALSASAEGLRTLVLALSVVEDPPGNGEPNVPYQLNWEQTYQFEARDQDGALLSVDWSVNPDIAARFSEVTPGKLEDIFEFAGDFAVIAGLDFDTFHWEGVAWCRVPLE